MYLGIIVGETNPGRLEPPIHPTSGLALAAYLFASPSAVSNRESRKVPTR